MTRPQLAYRLKKQALEANNESQAASPWIGVQRSRNSRRRTLPAAEISKAVKNST